jgi:MFS family permease
VPGDRVVTRLSRNRDYTLLWCSRAASEFGISATTIAFPLLVLAITGSAASSGLVLGAIGVAQLAAGLPAGALVDRWHRKRIMLACEAAQAVAAGSVVMAVLLRVVSVPQLVAVAAVIGVCAALFDPAEAASLPALVSDEQVPTAVAMNTARASLGHLSGTAAGGFLFAVSRFVPFAAETITHLGALAALPFVRLPPRPARTEAPGRMRHDIAAGLSWVWRQRAIRVTALCAVALNLFFTAFYLTVIVTARSHGVPAGEVGVMAAMLGAGGLIGALAAPFLCRKLSPHTAITGVFWVLTALTPVAVVIGNGYLLGTLFLVMALLPPTANTSIISEQLLLTADELRGRMSSVIGLLTGVAGAVGPMLGGVLTEVFGGRTAVLACAGGIAVVTVFATASPSLRRFQGARAASAEEVPAGTT